jgi:primary-amine oxidase
LRVSQIQTLFAHTRLTLFFYTHQICKNDPGVRAELQERYGMDPSSFGTTLICDPWSVHVPYPDLPELGWREDGKSARLIQCFLYFRNDEVRPWGFPKSQHCLRPLVDYSTRNVYCRTGNCYEPTLADSKLTFSVPNRQTDNQYAKPIDLLPVVDLNARKVVSCSRQPGATPPKVGFKTNVNYHRASLETNRCVLRVSQIQAHCLLIQD